MPSVINTNLASLNTQRNLTSSQANLATTIQRLSSGMRVNSAKDDAAGLAIAERMTSQSRGMTVAVRNANDGISLAQTAEGGLGKIGDMVQRIRELAIQSSNATNSTSDRASLQSEVKELRDQIQQVASTTNFNGTKLLDGSFQSAMFQVGADVGQSITIDSITNAQGSNMGQINQVTGTFSNTGAGAVTSLAAGDMTINGVDIGAVTGTGASGEITASDMVKAINGAAAQSGVYATQDGGGNLVLSSANTVDIGGANSGSAFAFTGLTSGSAQGTLASTTSMSNADISSVDGAQLAIMQADAALKQINTTRASLGAVQSRFENAISNLQTSNENITAAKSRIMDTDYAAESANLARAQILQQAGNAMLSQANQLPQQVMSLLKG